ncbi:hypothetical protein CYMTET_14542 [Cymbomonas tetramitiformis]|uniref:Plastid ribosomal protein S6 n=1 Tax=Cymbomonas tetramitiformis TaxID=36881 RepID=A0AAE0GG94_9CHLO|nr:hypothetical protein CYMTET_14542 [Cymbomonas tetramitiformis]
MASSTASVTRVVANISQKQSKTGAVTARPVVAAKHSSFAARASFTTRPRALVCSSSQVVAVLDSTIDEILAAEPDAPEPTPEGMNRYETMVMILADASDEEVTAEIEKVEAVLGEAGAVSIESLNRGRQPLAYNIKGSPEAIYVQVNYFGPGAAPKHFETVQSIPVLGDRKLIIRFMTHKQ